MSEDQPDEPKIIIDDDWKEQVQAEKEAAKQRVEPEAPKPQGPNPEGPAHELPPASFATLVSTLATQVLAALGHIPGPDGKPQVQREVAKHLIDTLAVLDEKTEGNLTPDEAAMLESLIHELRMAFVGLATQPPPAKPKSDIEIAR